MACPLASSSHQKEGYKIYNITLWGPKEVVHILTENVCIRIKISLGFVPKDPVDYKHDKSALVQVMAWCLQHQAIIWANVDPDSQPLHHMTSLDPNGSIIFLSCLNGNFKNWLLFLLEYLRKDIQCKYIYVYLWMCIYIYMYMVANMIWVGLFQW